MQIIATHPALELCPRNRQNPRKLGAAAAALPHRHDLIICLGAGPIHFVYCSHSPLAAAEIFLHKILFPPFLRGFSEIDITLPYT